MYFPIIANMVFKRQLPFDTGHLVERGGRSNTPANNFESIPAAKRTKRDTEAREEAILKNC